MSGEIIINQWDIDLLYQWLNKDAEPGGYHLNTSELQFPKNDIADQSSEDDIVHHLSFMKIWGENVMITEIT